MGFLLWLLLALLLAAAVYLFLIAPGFGKRGARRLKIDQRFYAHRGLHDNEHGLPENSMPAFRLAVEKGYGIELDVHLTKDQKMVVHHDASLLRICGVDRKIAQTTLEELAEYHLGNTDEKIPSLDEVLEAVNGQVPLLIELKADRFGNTALAQALNERMKAYAGPWWVESFDPLLIRWFKKHAPHVPRGQLAVDLKKEGKTPSLIERMAGYLLFHFLSRPDFVAYGYETDQNISFRVMRALFHPPVAAWTVRSKKDSEKLEASYDVQIFEAFHP